MTKEFITTRYHQNLPFSSPIIPMIILPEQVPSPVQRWEKHRVIQTQLTSDTPSPVGDRVKNKKERKKAVV